MSEAAFTVIVKQPGEPPEVVDWPWEPGAAGDHVLAKRIHETVGDTFCLAFNMESPASGRTILGYCDDEGLFKGLPLNFYRPSDGHPIVGPVVIMAAVVDREVPLDEQEIKLLEGLFEYVM